MKKLLLLPIVLLSFAFAAPAVSGSGSANKPFNATQTKAIEKIVHNYLVSNPQVLVEASQALQRQQRQQMQQRAFNAIPTVANDLFFNEHSPVVGAKQGKVTMVEFFDYRCPHCKRMTPIVEAVMKSHPQLRVVFKEWPIFGGPSLYAAKAALASVKQGKYFDFHNALMSAKQPLTNKSIIKIAEKVGLNTKQLQKDMKAPWVMKQINGNFKVAGKIGLQGTPAFIIVKTPKPGAKSSVQSLQIGFVPGETSRADLVSKIESIK